MREIFEDLIKKIKRTRCVVDYVESEDFFGIEIFRRNEDRITGKFIGKCGFAGDRLKMVSWAKSRRNRSLCEPGDPIKIITKFIKKEVLNKHELRIWTYFDMIDGRHEK